MLKRVLRYLIPLVAMAIAFIGNSSAATNEISSHPSDNISHCEFQDDCSFECSDGEPTLCLPRQISTSGHTHLHGTTKRCHNAHKNNFEYTQSGKCFNTCIGGYIHQYQLTTHLSFSKSRHRLIGLGKLII